MTETSTSSPARPKAVAPERLQQGPSPSPRLAPPEVIPPALAIWAPDPPTWGQRLIPKMVRAGMADLGLWVEPRPLKPSFHLVQVIQVLERYGWCQSFDFSPTGKMCIRGAQTFLESTGHVSPIGRGKAVNYLQSALHQQDVDMTFWAWNDLSHNTFEGVRAMISHASDIARKNGE